MADIILVVLFLIPALTCAADIEATASNLHIIRAWKKPFAFVLNQTPIRGQRVSNAATTLGDEATLDLSGVLAQPSIVLRNDHQDALNAGLAVNEYAPASQSAPQLPSPPHQPQPTLTHPPCPHVP